MAPRDTDVVPLTQPISESAADLIDTFTLSHGLRLADALIAAAAIDCRATLITGNVKHFSSLPGLTIEAFKP